MSSEVEFIEEKRNVLLVPVNKVRANFYSAFDGRLSSSFAHLQQPNVPYEDLNVKQKKIVDLVCQHLDYSVEDMLKNQLLLLIQGAAGTGKSTVLKYIKYLLEKKKSECPGFQFVVGSFTALAAFELKGTTLHHAFKVPCFKKDAVFESKYKEELSDDAKEYYSSIKFILIDEVGTLGKKLAQFINHKMKQADPARGHLPYAGRSVVFGGDFSQLNPVCDTALYAPIGPNSGISMWLQEELNKFLDDYRKITKVISLDNNYRQVIDGRANTEYLGFLSRMRNGELTDEDVALVQSRCYSQLTKEERNEFEEEIWAFPTNKKVAARNGQMLKFKFDRENKIIRIYDNRGNKELDLALTAPVLIRHNISQRAGVVNGAIGTVVHVHKPTKEEQKRGNVECIVVALKNYKGNVLVSTPNGNGLPIFRVRAMDMEAVGTTDTRSRIYPINLAFSFTLHKIQGKEFKKLAFELDKGEMVHNLDYTAFSRVQDISCIMILDSSVPEERLLMQNRFQEEQRSLQNAEEERLRELERKFWNEEQ